MITPQEQYVASDEIDLIELFGTLWDKKLTILLVTALCACLGLAYIFLTPGKYVGEVVLRGPIGARLAAFAPLNDEIKTHYKEFSVLSGDGEVNQFEISTDSLVRDMVRELQSYEAYENSLKAHDPDISGMSDDDFFRNRNELLSKFSIIQASDRNPDVKVTLAWDNEAQLLRILSETLKRAEQNVTTDKLELLNGLADNIERRKITKMQSAELALMTAQETIDLAQQSRLLLLQEQVALARELELSESRLIEGELGWSLGSQNQANPENQSSTALYLRGYKSLEKEIALIEARTKEQNYILNTSFLALKREAIDAQNDNTAEQFRAVISTSPFASGANIFDLDADAIRVNDEKSGSIILALFLLLGMIGSSVYVLIKGAFSKRNQRMSA